MKKQKKENKNPKSQGTVGKRAKFIAKMALAAGTTAISAETASEVKAMFFDQKGINWSQEEKIYRNEFFENMANMYNIVQNDVAKKDEEEFYKIDSNDIATIKLSDVYYDDVMTRTGIGLDEKDILDAYVMLDTANRKVMGGIAKSKGNIGEYYVEFTTQDPMKISSIKYDPAKFDFELHGGPKEGGEAAKYFSEMQKDYEDFKEKLNKYYSSLESSNNILDLAKKIYCDNYNNMYKTHIVPDDIKIWVSNVNGSFEVKNPKGYEIIYTNRKNTMENPILKNIYPTISTLTEDAIKFWKTYNYNYVLTGEGKKHILKDPQTYPAYREFVQRYREWERQKEVKEENDER